MKAVLQFKDYHVRVILNSLKKRPMGFQLVRECFLEYPLQFHYALEELQLWLGSRSSYISHGFLSVLLFQNRVFLKPE